MAPAFAVIYLSNRPGGFDLLWEVLRRQTCQDFELWVCDSLHERREALVSSHPAPWPVRFEPTPLDAGSVVMAIDRIARKSRAKFILELQDYSVIPPNFLERHLEIHDGLGQNAIVESHAEFYWPDGLFAPLPRLYGYAVDGDSRLGAERFAKLHDNQERESLFNDWFSAFAEDFRTGSLDHLLWSAFKTPLAEDLTTLTPAANWFAHDSRNAAAEGFVDATWCHLRCSSQRRDDFLLAGGFDARLDGLWGWGDTYIAKAMGKRTDTWVFYAKSIVIPTLRPYGYFYNRPVRHSETAQDRAVHAIIDAL